MELNKRNMSHLFGMKKKKQESKEKLSRNVVRSSYKVVYRLCYQASSFYNAAASSYNVISKSYYYSSNWLNVVYSSYNVASNSHKITLKWYDLAAGSDNYTKNSKHQLQMMLLLKKKEQEFRANLKCELKLEGEGSIRNYTFIDALGRSGSRRVGLVLLVKHKIENKQYAIKVLENSSTRVKRETEVDTIFELKLLRNLDFPFVLKMNYFFTDEYHIYVVMPHVVGGDLAQKLIKRYRFNERLTRFYAVQIILGLEYLHSMGLIYRDMKLKNILLESDGYIKITDFSYTRLLKKSERTKDTTKCGTLEYLAPERIKGKRYNRGVDWWAVGVSIFEMLSGEKPFQPLNNFKYFQNIINCELKFPKYFTPFSRRVILDFLQVDETKRLGCTPMGMLDLKRHVWFRGVDWNSVLHKKVNPSCFETPKPRKNHREHYYSSSSEDEDRFEEVPFKDLFPY